MTYGEVVDENGALIDRGLAVLALAPKSYTGEDTLELHVHGAPVVARETLRAVIATGARLAGAGEFTRRAFLNGKLDLHAASSVADLIAAEHRSAAQAALANMGSALAREVRAMRARLASILEEIAAAIDYPDEVAEPDRMRVAETLSGIGAGLQQLLQGAEIGRLVRDGLDVAIVGPPNAGKSSLLNALLGEERALVSEIAGTTRDTIEEAIAIDGVLVRLTDTAGVRDGAQSLEAAGIERTARALAGARVALVVIDASQLLGAAARRILQQTKERARILFFNKADLGEIAYRTRPDDLTDAILGSVRNHKTLVAVRDAIAQHGWNARTPDLQRPALACMREVDAVARALESLERANETLRRGMPADLLAPDLQAAFAALGHLTGDAVTEELLDGIFARFCVGK